MLAGGTGLCVRKPNSLAPRYPIISSPQCKQLVAACMTLQLNSACNGAFQACTTAQGSILSSKGWGPQKWQGYSHSYSRNIYSWKVREIVGEEGATVREVCLDSSSGPPPPPSMLPASMFAHGTVPTPATLSPPAHLGQKPCIPPVCGGQDVLDLQTFVNQHEAQWGAPKINFQACAGE